MRTGAFFASALRREPLLHDAEVLDLGTGCGICALVAARRARHVAAVDLSRTAARCAQINVLLGGLEHRIEVLQGDLYAPVNGQRFDLILFNPPFLREQPRDEADLAWRSLDVAERFAAGLDDHLSPSGSALLLLSTFGEAGAFLRPLADAGFAITLHARREYLNERLSLFRVRRPQAP
jgi:release factor glutamine methyltransferase